MVIIRTFLTALFQCFIHSNPYKKDNVIAFSEVFICTFIRNGIYYSMETGNSTVLYNEYLKQKIMGRGAEQKVFRKIHVKISKT